MFPSNIEIDVEDELRTGRCEPIETTQGQEAVDVILRSVKEDNPISLMLFLLFLQKKSRLNC